jgi:hypothetical protein
VIIATTLAIQKMNADEKREMRRKAAKTETKAG